MSWQEICSRNSVKFGANLEQITIFTEVRKMVDQNPLILVFRNIIYC